MSYSKTIELTNSSGVILIGKTVRAVAPGSDWASGLTMAELASSGKYRKSDFSDAQSGMYIVWVGDSPASGATTNEPINVGPVDSNGIKDGEVIVSKITIDADLDFDDNKATNLPDDEETSGASLRHIKMTSYPLEDWVENGDIRLYKAIKQIRLQGSGIDNTKDYFIRWVEKNVGGICRFYIYERVSNTFVCRYYEATYTPPDGVEEITVPEYGGSNIVAKVIIDWSVLPDGFQFQTANGLKINRKCYIDPLPQIEADIVANASDISDNADDITKVNNRTDTNLFILQENFNSNLFNFDWSKLIINAEIIPKSNTAYDYMYKSGIIRQVAIYYIQQVTAPNDYKASMYIQKDDSTWSNSIINGTIGVDGTATELLLHYEGWTPETGSGDIDVKIWIDTTVFGAETTTGISGITYAGDCQLSKAFIMRNLLKYVTDMAERQTTDLGLPFWQRANIYKAVGRIPSFFRRINPTNPGSPGSMLYRFNIALFPDIHEDWDPDNLNAALDRYKYFISLISHWSPSSQIVQAAVIQGDLLIDYDPAHSKSESLAKLDEIAGYIENFGIDLLLGTGNHDWNERYPDEDHIPISQAVLESEMRSHVIDEVDTYVSGINLDAAKPAGCYYYKDYISSQSGGYKVRVIMLDQYDLPETVTGGYMDYPRQYNCAMGQKQLDWLADYALNIPSSDYIVLIFCHEGHSPANAQNDSFTAMQEIIDAFATNGSYSISDSTPADLSFTVSGDFNVINGFSGKFAGIFFGHGHIPSTGTFTVNDNHYNHIELPAGYDGGSIGFNRQAETGIQDMIDFLSIDHIDQRIYLLRYGNPANKNGVGLPFGDRGFDSPITF